MHEMAIAGGILDIVLQTAAEHKAARVTAIKLLIGEMTEVEPESLRFCFDALAVDTPAAGAAFEIETVPLIGRCQACGLEFKIERFRFLCPTCQSSAIEVLSGRELRVEHLEVE